jgi:hypothetical protein
MGIVTSVQYRNSCGNPPFSSTCCNHKKFPPHNMHRERNCIVFYIVSWTGKRFGTICSIGPSAPNILPQGNQTAA